MPCTVQTFAVVKHQRFHPFGDRIRLCIHFFPLSVNSISSFSILSSLDSILTGFYPRFLPIKKSYFSLTAQDSRFAYDLSSAFIEDPADYLRYLVQLRAAFEAH